VPDACLTPQELPALNLDRLAKSLHRQYFANKGQPLRGVMVGRFRRIGLRLRGQSHPRSGRNAILPFQFNAGA